MNGGFDSWVQESNMPGAGEIRSAPGTKLVTFQ